MVVFKFVGEVHLSVAECQAVVDVKVHDVALDKFHALDLRRVGAVLLKGAAQARGRAGDVYKGVATAHVPAVVGYLHLGGVIVGLSAYPLTAEVQLVAVVAHL